MLDEKAEKRVFEFIASAKDPIHSTEISKALGINRVTISKYLSVLHSRGLISFKNIGMAKVWKAIENPVLQAFELNDEENTTIQALNALSDGVCVLNKDLKIVWLNKAMEKRHGRLAGLKGKNCFDVFHDEEEICSNCPSKRTFSKGKKDGALIKKRDSTIEITTSPLKDKKGRTVAVIEIVRVTGKGNGRSVIRK